MILVHSDMNIVTYYKFLPHKRQKWFIDYLTFVTI